MLSQDLVSPTLLKETSTREVITVLSFASRALFPDSASRRILVKNPILVPILIAVSTKVQHKHG